jgi:hypothetical protein
MQKRKRRAEENGGTFGGNSLQFGRSKTGVPEVLRTHTGSGEPLGKAAGVFAIEKLASFKYNLSNIFY